MKRSVVKLTRVLATCGLSFLFGALQLSSHEAAAQEAVPPPEFIATVEPVYFDGHAAYWWGHRWYYRDGEAWTHYPSEPGFLRDWRARPGFGGRFHYDRGGFRGGFFDGHR